MYMYLTFHSVIRDYATFFFLLASIPSLDSRFASKS